MTTSLLISIVSLGLAILGAVLGLYKYFVGKNEALRELHQKDIDFLKKDYDDKIGIVFRRFDEYKKNIEDKFVYRQICEVMHTNTAESFDKLDKKVDTGFTEVKQSLALLTEKLLNK